MAFDDQLRELKERVLIPPADTIGKFVHPNTVSLIGFCLGVAAGGAVLAGQMAVGVVLWALNRIIDGLDGTIARRTGRQTDFGGYLDILLDFAVYAWVPLAFAIQADSRNVFLALGFLLGSFYLNAGSWIMLAAILERRNLYTTVEQTTVIMPSGLIEGAETIAFFTAFFIWPGQLVVIFTLMGVLVLYTVMQRLIWAYRHL